MILKLEGQFVGIIFDVNKEYEKYVIYEQKGKKRMKTLYLKVLRALYGAIESALQW